MSRQRVLPSQQSQSQIPLPPSSSSNGQPFSDLAVEGGSNGRRPSYDHQPQQQRSTPRGGRTPTLREQRLQQQLDYEQQQQQSYDDRPPSPTSREPPRPSNGRSSGRDRERDRDRRERERAGGGDRQQPRGPPRSAPPPSFKIDEEAILKTYNLSTLQPEYWEDTSSSSAEASTSAAGSPPPGNTGRGGIDPKQQVQHDEPDPLGLYRGSVLSNIPELPKDIKASIFTQLKGFDPKMFLTHVHPAAGPDDLAYGREKLKESMESRTGAVQRLVEENFDRFVAIKAATFNVYDEMKLGPLAPEGDYSIADLKESLKLAQTKVDAVWNPILDARLKADRLRSTLGVFERSKFFFTLPGVLSESIASGRYDLFLASYNKGKYLLDSRPGALLGLPPGAVMTEAQREKHGRVFEKVWSQIERIRDDFKDLLIEQLKDPRREIEGVERNVEILLELDPSSEPVWLYFDTQHRSIKEVLQRAHTSAVTKHQAVLSKSQTSDWTEDKAAWNLRTCVWALDTQMSDSVISQGAGQEAWKALEDLVHTLCDVLLQTLPNFWKVAKAYLDGRYQPKDNGSDRHGKTGKRAEQLAYSSKRSPSQVRVMMSEMVNLYVSLLGGFLRLSSDTNSPSMPQGTGEGEATGPALPAFVPTQTNAPTAGHHLLIILNELTDCTNDIGGLAGIGMDVQNSLKEFMSAVRWKFTDLICTLWIKDARAFHRLEDWKLDNDDQSRTVYLKRITAYQKVIARLAYRASGGNEEAASNLFVSGNSAALFSRGMRDQSIPTNFARRIHSAYLDALYLFLDGLVALAFSEQDRLRDPALPPPPDDAKEPLSPRTKTQKLDIKDRDVRILLAISNLSHFRTDFIAKIVDQLKTALKVDMSQDSKTLNDVVNQLDKILFDEYVKARSAALKAMIEQGVLSPAMDWYSAPKPTEVRSYIYDALLSLVLVHSQVTAIARSLVSRAVGALVEELAKHALQAFSQVSRFGMGGMLQATLEMEFLHQTLNVHVSPTADATLQEIYKIISQAYRPQSGQDGSNGELQRELEQLKLTLTQARRATALQFLCFREKRLTHAEPGVK